MAFAPQHVNHAYCVPSRPLHTRILDSGPISAYTTSVPHNTHGTPSVNQSKHTLKETGQLATQAVHRNVKRLLDLHQELSDLSGVNRERKRLKGKFGLRTGQVQNLHSLVLLLSSFGQALSRTFRLRSNIAPNHPPIINLDRSLVRALQNRIRRLRQAVQRAPARKKKRRDQYGRNWSPSRR